MIGHVIAKRGHQVQLAKVVHGQLDGRNHGRPLSGRSDTLNDDRGWINSFNKH